jgi:hypothetical protein
MPHPEGWPTLADVGGARELYSPITHEQALRLATAADWALRVYPALTALVERWRSEEYADAIMLNEAAVSQADRCADELAAILARTKETRE